jgi:dihydroorotate dehydrogenase
MIYRALFDSVFRRIDPERSHELGFRAMRAAAHVPGLVALAGGRRPRQIDQRISAFGLQFPGPLGIAAGFDKNAVGIDALAALGFSFVEVGTVTGVAQRGNDTPRLFRLPADRALVNRMGFNNDGAAIVGARLAAWRRSRRRTDVVVGVNIGKSKIVAEEDAIGDYELSARLLAPYADYLVVNVSSPNTPGLRSLQDVSRLGPLLSAVGKHADAAAGQHVPLLVKIAPDLADGDVRAIVRLALDLGIDGVVAVNTTIGRHGLTSPSDLVAAAGAGGLSGAPLAARSTEVLGLIRDETPTLPVISVGGIFTADDVKQRLASGATLVQAYTGFVYGGPAWPARVQRG